MTGSSSLSNKHVLTSERLRGAAGCGSGAGTPIASLRTLSSSVWGRWMLCVVVSATALLPVGPCHLPCCADLVAGAAGPALRAQR